MDEETPVKVIRLVTGEDVVTELTEITEKDFVYYLMNNPLKVVYMVGNKPGILSISLMQWMFSNICENQQFVLDPKDILTMGEPTEYLITHYYECVDTFTEKKEKSLDFNKSKKPDIVEENDFDREVPLEELQEVIRSHLDNKKRTLH